MRRKYTLPIFLLFIYAREAIPFNSRLYCSLFVKVLSKSSVKYEKERLTLCFANKHVCFQRVLYICNTAIGGEDERNCNNNQQQVGNNNQNDNVTNSVTIHERKRHFVRSKFMQALCVFLRQTSQPYRRNKSTSTLDRRSTSQSTVNSIYIDEGLN